LIPFLAVMLSACGKSAQDTPASDEDADAICGDSGTCNRETPLCDREEGCVECQFDSDCSEDERCATFVCESKNDCEGAADCEDTGFPVCGPQGECLECVIHDDCEADERCDTDHHCSGVENCSTSTDCKGDDVCDRHAGYCVSCVVDGDCGEGDVCSNHECISACVGNEGCGAEREYCDSALGHCAECLTDEHCAEEYYCAQGTCVLDACEVDAQSCSAETNSIVSCRRNGSGTSELPCPTGTTCFEGVSSVTCEAWLCNPEDISCDDSGNVLRTCALDGLTLETEVDCRESGGRCENSACVDTVCQAGSTFCKEGSSMHCNSLGTAFTTAAVCGVGSYCEESSGLCEVNVCSPNSATCDGSVVKTCRADGSGFLVGETDCAASGEACFRGECRAIVCDYDSRCNGTNREICAGSGTYLSSIACSSLTHCVDGEGTAGCVSDVCTQGTTSCNGSSFETCNADGSAVLARVDCAAQSLLCDSTTGCRAQTGSTSYSSSSDYYVHANHYAATSTVTLTSISQYANTYSSTAMHWVVYESDTETGTYTRILDVTSNALSTSTVWHVSPALNVTLEAGKFYMIGVHIFNVDYAYYGTMASGTTGPLTPGGRTAFYDYSPIEAARNVTAPTSATLAYYQRLGLQ